MANANDELITPAMIDAGLAVLEEGGLIETDECGRAIWPENINLAWPERVYLAMRRYVSVLGTGGPAGESTEEMRQIAKHNSEQLQKTSNV
jgi:hypothetical protein